jgi:hypothetical protein
VRFLLKDAIDDTADPKTLKDEGFDATLHVALSEVTVELGLIK